MTGNVITEQLKTGIPTLKIAKDCRTHYVHSKYDSEKDAERFVNKVENETYKHVLFVGTGHCYHIKKFTETYSDSKFSIYEPDEEVLLTYLTHAKLDALPVQKLTQIFTGTELDDITNNMRQLLQSSKGILQIITLPIYERIYGAQINTIMKKTLETLKDNRSSLATNFSFQQRWTINSIKNFPTVLKTPNILHDIDKSIFEGKPAIIVAAGPSLNEEFENLRYIKGNGLAYVFSVGSAVNALIEHGIYPDAACTYDPTERNHLVIQRIKDENITDIPLVFGSSVGFETLEDYPGIMLQMITSQDTIAPQLLDTKQAIDVVMDAPSIAVVTFQLLNQLQCNPIILVGQNLGFQDNKRYAAGIDYGFVENELSEQEQKSTLTIKDVYGNDIQTSEGFNRMRQQFELHIQSTIGREVVNTTKGGAHIKGSTFTPLVEMISDELTTKVVQNGWDDKVNHYNLELTQNKLRTLSHAEKECNGILDSSFNQLKRIHNAIQLRQSKGMEKLFSNFDKEYNKLNRNVYYKSFIGPMVRVQNDFLYEESKRVRFEKDGLKKAEVIVRIFNSFLQDVNNQIEFARPYFYEMEENIGNKLIIVKQ